MRIKIIGENNCARATRHLLRLAGFAVTEFLPAEVVTQAPHLGFAITIETASPASGIVPGTEDGATPSMTRKFSEGVTSISRAPRPSPGPTSTAQNSDSWAASAAHTRLAPAPQPLNSADGPQTGASADLPTSQPGSSTHGQPAIHGEASPVDGGASSPAFFSGGEDSGSEKVLADLAGIAHCRMSDDGDLKGRQAEACPTGNIHFDSVDGELEGAILRHVTQLAAAPVMVDRPGGVVHSERELRIVVPVTGDVRADEAAAVAVEFGVLRGLLDLTRRPSRGELSAVAAGGDSSTAGKFVERRGGKSKWWIFGAVLLGAAVAFLGAALDASPRASGGVNAGGAPAEIRIAGGGGALVAHPRNLLQGRIVRGAALRAAAGFAAAEPQGQFATGQAGASTLDPCQAQTKLFASINQTANAQLVAGTSSKKIYVCSIHVVVAAATSVALVEGTGTVCGTGTAGVSGFGGATAATGWNFMANGGIALGNGGAAVGAEGTSADNLCLFNSGSGQVSGGISYVVQ